MVAREAEARQDWESVAKSLREVLDLDPAHAQAAVDLHRAQDQIKLAALYAQGCQLYQEERWHESLRAFRQVQRVDGNLVYLCTDNDLYFSRLHQQPAKLNALERALHDVHRVPVRVQVTLVDTLEQATSAGVDQTASDLDVDDPLLATGLELGGQISSDDDEYDSGEYNSEDEVSNEE